MSAQCEVVGKRAAAAPLSFFERYLTIWVFICIVVGLVVVPPAIQLTRHRIGERFGVRARSVLGGLHHEYRLAPASA